MVCAFLTSQKQPRRRDTAFARLRRPQLRRVLVRTQQHTRKGVKRCLEIKRAKQRVRSVSSQTRLARRLPRSVLSQGVVSHSPVIPPYLARALSLWGRQAHSKPSRLPVRKRWSLELISCWSALLGSRLHYSTPIGRHQDKCFRRESQCWKGSLAVGSWANPARHTRKLKTLPGWFVGLLARTLGFRQPERLDLGASTRPYRREKPRQGELVWEPQGSNLFLWLCLKSLQLQEH